MTDGAQSTETISPRHSGGRTREPWLAVLLAVLVTPLVAMLYVGRWWLGFGYLLLQFAAPVLAAWAAMRLGLPWMTAVSTAYLLVLFAGASHAHQLAAAQRTGFRGPWFSRWYGIAGVWLVLATGVFVVRAVFYEPYRAPSGSMMPALLPGDFFLVNKLPYGHYGTFGIDFSPAVAWASDPEPGDVVVFRYPPNPSVRYVKRLIGRPGDIIEVRGATLYVNGVEVPHVPAPRPEALEALHTVVASTEELYGKRYTVVHDQRRDGHRSPTHTWTVPEGQFFMMGDNRDYSNDSRSWGFVPRENIIGKAVLVWWSIDPQHPETVRSERVGVRLP